MIVDDLLFVYGTLRRGGSHHPLLRGAEWLSSWVSGPHYRMLDMGDYPALIEGRGKIVGEIYRIEQELLPALDMYEGCPGDYRRERIETGLGDAWIYLWDRQAPSVPEIAGGDWIVHIASRWPGLID